MDKKRLFQIMANADREIIGQLAKKTKQENHIVIVKEPAKTLAMIKMREPVQSSMFYIGEVIVTECMVELDGTCGMAVTMGDDFEKTLDMAIIDAAYNKGIFKEEEKLAALEREQQIRYQKENAMHLKTMVNFKSMDQEVPKDVNAFKKV